MYKVMLVNSANQFLGYTSVATEVEAAALSPVYWKVG